MPLDINKLAPVALYEGAAEFYVATVGDETHMALPLATYSALVEELRGAREALAAIIAKPDHPMRDPLKQIARTALAGKDAT